MCDSARHKGQRSRNRRFLFFSASAPWGLFKSIRCFSCVVFGRQRSRSCGYFHAKMLGIRRTAKSNRSKPALATCGLGWRWRSRHRPGPGPQRCHSNRALGQTANGVGCRLPGGRTFVRHTRCGVVAAVRVVRENEKRRTLYYGCLIAFRPRAAGLQCFTSQGAETQHPIHFSCVPARSHTTTTRAGEQTESEHADNNVSTNKRR